MDFCQAVTADIKRHLAVYLGIIRATYAGADNVDVDNKKQPLASGVARWMLRPMIARFYHFFYQQSVALLWV